MPSFLRGLFETKSSAPPNPIPRAISNSRTGFAGGMPGSQVWDTDQAINQGYERVIWVYRCIDAIASNSAAVPMVVRKYDGKDGMDVVDPELLTVLNRRPNIYETATQFRYRLASQLLLSRRGVFIEVVRNRMGRPSELHLLPPGATTPIPDPKKYVTGYSVQTTHQGQVELDPHQVIWIKAKPHPTDVYAQMTPLVSAGLAIDTDWLARLYNRNFLANDGRPGLIVAVQGQLMPEDAEEIRRRFSGGPTSAGQTTVIEADNITATDMSSTPRDSMWQETVKGSKEDILLAFGTPESVLGNASGRTFDNADAEAEVWWTATMRPFMDSITAGFDTLTAEGVDDEFYVAHDYTKIDVLQRQTRMRHEKALTEFQAGVLSIDDYLEAVGRDPVNVPGTRVLWIPAGNVPVGANDEDTAAAAALTPVGAGKPADIGEEARSGALLGVASGQRQFQNELQARALRLAGKQLSPLGPTSPSLQIKGSPKTDLLELKADVIDIKAERHPYQNRRGAVEAEIGAVINSWSRRQERTVVERIGGVKARKHTRHWEGAPGSKALDAIYVTNPEAWADDLVDDLGEVMRAIGEKEALRAARELDKAGVLQKIIDDGTGFPGGRTPLDRLVGSSGLTRRQVIEYPVSAVEDMIRESALRQSQRIADRITELDNEGASIADIKKEVRKMIGSRSSWKRGVSVAAATSIMEGARSEVFSRGGKYVQRVWRTMRDEKVRPTHRKANGQRRAADSKFKVGAALLKFPGDMTGLIEETANCFVDGTVVEARGVSGGYRREYNGPLVTLQASGVDNLSGTPNHPILTTRGWVLMGQLQPGDYLVGTGFGQNMAVTHPYVDRGPASIDQVIDTLENLGVTTRISGSRMQFHGDGTDRDVDVVRANGTLWVSSESTGFQPFSDENFTGRDLLLARQSLISEFGGRRDTSTPSRLGSNSIGGTLLRSPVSDHQAVSGDLASRLDTLFEQSPRNSVATNAKMFSELINAGTTGVTLHKVINVDIDSQWHGYVSNLETADGLYIANGIVAHNCRCWLEYRIRPTQ